MAEVPGSVVAVALAGQDRRLTPCDLSFEGEKAGGLVYDGAGLDI